jgi:hypothetical protein
MREEDVAEDQIFENITAAIPSFVDAFTHYSKLINRTMEVVLSSSSTFPLNIGDFDFTPPLVEVIVQPKIESKLIIAFAGLTELTNKLAETIHLAVTTAVIDQHVQVARVIMKNGTVEVTVASTSSNKKALDDLVTAALANITAAVILSDPTLSGQVTISATPAPATYLFLELNYSTCRICSHD